MKKARLFRKFTAAFLGFVFVPFMVILVALLLHSNKLQLQNDLAYNENLTAQTVDAIHQESELAKNMCKAIIQNQNLINFLDKQYETSPDLLYYCTTIRDFVRVTNGVSDVKLRIYLENNSIPMGFGIFFPIHYINRTQTFLDFYNSPEATDIWLNGTFDAELPEDQRIGQDNAYHYFHKIQVGPRLIGVIEAMVPKNIFEVTDSFSETVLKPTDLPHSCLYNYSGQTLPLDSVSLDALAASPASGYNSRYVWSYTEIPGGPFDVIVVSSRGQLTILTVALMLLFPALFIAMIAGFFAYNRRTIRDIHSCLDSMEAAIKNNFELPAQGIPHPLEDISRRNDEISTLAHRIRYLLRQTHSLLEERVQQQTAAKEAELLALQHQINPHFLYNTMEVFSSRMELAGLYEESDAISAFCRMLRYNMNTKDLMTTLQDEVRQVEYYLSIQKIRGIPFEITFDIPEHLLPERSIRFLLEPFIENSFKHRGTAAPLRIFVTAEDRGRDIEIIVQNNGEALTPERVAELNERFRNAPPSMKTDGQRIGLNNINSRLKLFYGEQYFIHVESDGLITTFSFSIERKPAVSSEGF